MLKRKAQGVSIGIIVIAAIALVVIVIIIGLLTGKLGSFGGGIDLLGDPTRPCHEQGTPRDKCEEDETQIISSDAAGKGQKCCKSTTPPPVVDPCAGCPGAYAECILQGDCEPNNCCVQ